MRTNDLAGKIFGQLVVLRQYGVDKNKNSVWLCKCACGNIKTILGINLKNGSTISCGCVREAIKGSYEDLKGLRFSRWLVKSFSHIRNGKPFWNCTCDCGKEAQVYSQTLKNGESKSCGCFAKEQIKIKFTKTLGEFISDAKKIHGDAYDYSLVNYINGKEKVSILCEAHGRFEQSPSNHLRGKGCPYCSNYGFDRTKYGFVYILKSRDYVKIGITNREVDVRVAEINRNLEHKFLVTWKTNLTGDMCCAVEKYALKILKQAGYTQPTDLFNGSTECFADVDVEIVIKVVKDSIEQLALYID